MTEQIEIKPISEVQSLKNEVTELKSMVGKVCAFLSQPQAASAVKRAKTVKTELTMSKSDIAAYAKAYGVSKAIARSELWYLTKKQMSVVERGLHITKTLADGSRKTFDAVKFNDGTTGILVRGNSYIIPSSNMKD